MAEKIEVRYGPTTLGNSVPVKHKYIVYTDSDGNQWATRGGPDWSDLSIVTASGPYDKNFKDWDDDGILDPRETIIEGDDLSDAWNKIIQAMDDIEKEDHLYRPMQQNSNTAVDEALRRSGLPEPVDDDGHTENWSPGSGRDLPGGGDTASGGTDFSDELIDWMNEKIGKEIHTFNDMDLRF